LCREDAFELSSRLASGDYPGIQLIGVIKEVAPVKGAATDAEWLLFLTDCVVYGLCFGVYHDLILLYYLVFCSCFECDIFECKYLKTILKYLDYGESLEMISISALSYLVNAAEA